MSSPVTIVLDEALPLLDRTQTAVQTATLARTGLRAIAGLLQSHLRTLDTQRHRTGRRHFYREAADSVTLAESSTGGVLSITKVGFAQRLYGGVIKAKNKKFLTIPAIPEAENTLATEWSGLRPGLAYDPKLGSLRLALIRASPSSRVTITRKGTVDHTHLSTLTATQPIFWLVREVSQKRDPSVLPTNRDMADTALAAMTAQLPHN